jgi:hypothetical protein
MSTINIGNIVSGSTAMPSGVISTQYFFFRWFGYLIPTVTGLHIIGVNAAGATSVFIGNVAVVNAGNNNDTANTTLAYTESGTILLTAGVYYPLTVEWQSSAFSANYQMSLAWTPPGGSIALIPTTSLSSSGSSITGDLNADGWQGAVEGNFLIADGYGGYTDAGYPFISPAADMYIYIPTVAGIYAANQELFYSQPVRTITLPIGLTNTNAGCRVAPTGNVVVTLEKNGSSIGTINFTAASTTPTFTFTSAVTFTPGTSPPIDGGDSFSIIAPSSSDATFAGFWADFYASRID